jgi:hypothetical protein
MPHSTAKKHRLVRERADRNRSLRISAALVATEGKPVSGLDRLKLSLSVLLLLLLAPASAFAARGSRIDAKVAGACAGDVVTGRVTLRAPRGAAFTVRLFEQGRAKARWTWTKRAKRFKSLGGLRSYGVRFDVSAFDAYAYRLAVNGRQRRAQSPPIASASCAPGAQVPEAPIALLLPLSLLGTASLLLLRRRASY